MNHSALDAPVRRSLFEGILQGFGSNEICIRITDKEDGSHHIAVCTQCGKCSEVCNTGVITEDARGVYRLNKKASAGCLMCVGFCPENVMVQCDDYLEPSKCTACGLCVKACPTGAIRLVEE